jgi:hypothetical protein
MHRLKSMLIQSAILVFSIPVLGEDLELNASNSLGFVMSKDTWTVHLRGTELKIEQPMKKKIKVKRIKPSDIETLRRTFDQGVFASLRSTYGCTQCFDAGGCFLKVSSGMWKHSVSVIPYINMSTEYQKDAADIRRFMEVWKLIKRIAGLSSMKDMCPNGTGPTPEIGH